MNLVNAVPSSRTNASFRFELVSMVFVAALSVVLVCLFDTGWLAQWLANHKGTKIDEIVFVGIGLLVAIGFVTFRRWLGLSQFVARYNGAVELSPEISRVKQAQQKDLFRIALAGAVSVLLVFLFDTGSIAEWIAQHKDSKIDETIVTGVILLIGLLFFSIRRWFEYTEQVVRYEELHRKTTELNREIKLMSALGESLQSCLSVEEAHQLITASARVLFPGSSGAVCIIANSRDMVEVVASWGESLPHQSYFEPKDCLALRRGRLHRVEIEGPGLSCAHLGKERHVGSLCVPMMAHGETMGLLYVSPCSVDGTTSAPNEPARSEERLARTLAEQSALALANLRMRDALKMQSIRDPLTGLFNRRYMEESVERELRRAARKQSVMGVLMIDIDHFKKLNDSLGHEAGDIVLREFGSLLKGHFRASDIVCRYGGEEFTVIMPETSLESTRERALELCKAARQLLVQHKGQTLQPISVSIGVAILGEHGAAAETLLRAADSALYRAKQQGRDRVITADQLTIKATPSWPNPTSGQREQVSSEASTQNTILRNFAD